MALVLTMSVFVSCNDSYGTLSLADGRTDVNILATINPTTKQILLTTTPRDYYVVQPIYESRDKLTHAGLWGIDCSMETLSDYYDVDIKYYGQINFTGFKLPVRLFFRQYRIDALYFPGRVFRAHGLWTVLGAESVSLGLSADGVHETAEEEISKTAGFPAVFCVSNCSLSL